MQPQREMDITIYYIILHANSEDWTVYKKPKVDIMSYLNKHFTAGMYLI